MAYVRSVTKRVTNTALLRQKGGPADPVRPKPIVAWEWPNDARQGHDFLSLLAAVRIHLPEDRFFLSAALPAHRALLRHVDLGAAAEYVDRVNLMAFDLFGPWSRSSGHHAQLYAIGRDAADHDSGSAAVACLLSRGVPASKILFGVPVYGRSFLAATGPGQPFGGGGGDAGTFEYRALPRPGAAEVVDKRHIAAQCVGADGGFVSYDNPETVKAKATFCKQKGLAVSFCLSPTRCQSKKQRRIGGGGG